jgi:hypothetical protein
MGDLKPKTAITGTPPWDVGPLDIVGGGVVGKALKAKRKAKIVKELMERGKTATDMGKKYLRKRRLKKAVDKRTKEHFKKAEEQLDNPLTKMLLGNVKPKKHGVTKAAIKSLKDDRVLKRNTKEKLSDLKKNRDSYQRDRRMKWLEKEIVKDSDKIRKLIETQKKAMDAKKNKKSFKLLKGGKKDE